MRRAPSQLAFTLFVALTGVFGSATADYINIERLSNGNLAASMDGCSVLFDATGRALTEGSTCTRDQLGEASQAARQYLQSPAGGGKITMVIDRVEYGAGDRTCDATRAIASACSGQSACNVRIDNQLCGDPASGTRKEATISFRCGGSPREERISEGGMANLSCTAPSADPVTRPTRPSRPAGRPSRPILAGNDQISILGVEYGADRNTCDATRVFDRECGGRSSCSVNVGNNLCGDPARGTEKAAEIEYRCGRRTYRETVEEGATAQLDCDSDVFHGNNRPGRQRPGLVYIDTVDYGAANQTCDATTPFDDACSGRNSCRVDVDNDLCGDPARGTAKRAEIYYWCNGRSRQESVDEGRTASLRCD